MEITMKSDKKIKASTILKSAVLFTVLTLATACSGGGGSSVSTARPVGDNTVTPAPVSSATQASLKMELCDEVNGWDNDCRFVGMKYLNLNPEEIIPLTEAHGRGRNRGGRDA